MRLSIAAGLLATLWVAAPAQAQDSSTFTVALLGGVGGAFDGDGERTLDRPAVQASFAMVTNDRTLTVVRVGRLAFGGEQSFDGRLDAELDYIQIAGEYRFRQPSYDYGLFLGLGGYRLSGEQVSLGAAEDETAVGFALGFTGDFDLTQHLSFVAELDFHYALFDEARVYGAALAGVAVHF